jgi:hypothetical protein
MVWKLWKLLRWWNGFKLQNCWFWVIEVITNVFCNRKWILACVEMVSEIKLSAAFDCGLELTIRFRIGEWSTLTRKELSDYTMMPVPYQILDQLFDQLWTIHSKTICNILKTSAIILIIVYYSSWKVEVGPMTIMDRCWLYTYPRYEDGYQFIEPL